MIALERLGVKDEEDSDLKLFLEDGSRIYEDEDITDKDLVDGKLLLIAHKADDLKKKEKEECGMLI